MSYWPPAFSISSWQLWACQNDIRLFLISSICQLWAGHIGIRPLVYIDLATLGVSNDWPHTFFCFIINVAPLGVPYSPLGAFHQFGDFGRVILASGGFFIYQVGNFGRVTLASAHFSSFWQLWVCQIGIRLCSPSIWQLWACHIRLRRFY